MTQAHLCYVQVAAILLIVLAHDAVLAWGAFTLAYKYFPQKVSLKDAVSSPLNLLPGGGKVNIGSGESITAE